MARKKNNEITIRSSAAEYLTFIAATGDNPESVEMRYEDENIWLTQKMFATLYNVEVHTINEHISKIYADGELTQAATIRNFRIVQTEGSRQVSREVKHYSLQMIIAVGFKVNNERAVQFRKWANQIMKDYTIKGFAMDDERLKNGGSILTEQYFEEQLQRIREIRLSERKFYQKITDIYATAIDYDVTANATKRFFATVQNKLHWAIHGQTASEVIYTRADAEKEHMGLTTWKDAPHGKIQKFDVSVAKNYLTEFEMGQLQRLVSAYLDIAEDMALRHIPMTMQDWETRLNGFIQATDRAVLQDAGKVTAEIAKAHAEAEFEKYRIVQDKLFESDFDRQINLSKQQQIAKTDNKNS
ncbi:MAG: virulence RhuM family protein [Clostridia bacterium]|nr:virulence RhuM family protein [Clostridia bacterium]